MLLNSLAMLITNRYRILAGEAAEAEAAVAGVVEVAGGVNGFEQAPYADKGKAVRAQGFAYFVGAAGVADQVFAVGRVNAEIVGAAYIEKRWRSRYGLIIITYIEDRILHF